MNRLKLAAKILALACSLDQRAALERARAAASTKHIDGLVEQVGAGPSLPALSHADHAH